MAFDFVSPCSHEPLSWVDSSYVSASGETYPIVNGIPQLVDATMLAGVEEFSSTYAAVRIAEGRSSASSEYYRALPHDDLTGQFRDQWSRRALTFGALVGQIEGDGLDIVDVGAGNCWLSARLAELGHSLLALDLNDDGHDGLAASRHYPESFQVARAHGLAIPLREASADMVVFNAAAHYFPLREAISEACRILRLGGRIVIADSPVYKQESAGVAMVESMSDYIVSLGVEPAAHAGKGFLTDRDLADCGVRWRRTDLDGTGLRSIRRKVAGYRAGRELATLPLLVAPIGHHADTRQDL